MGDRDRDMTSLELGLGVVRVWRLEKLELAVYKRNSTAVSWCPSGS